MRARVGAMMPVRLYSHLLPRYSEQQPRSAPFETVVGRDLTGCYRQQMCALHYCFSDKFILVSVYDIPRQISRPNRQFGFGGA